MDKWIIIHPTYLLPNPFMTQPAHLPPLVGSWTLLLCEFLWYMDNLSVPNIMTTLDKCWLIL